MKMDQAVRQHTKKPEQTQQRSSEWGKCSCDGCPMHATAKPEGGNGVCAYHLGCDYQDRAAITTAVKEYVKHHNFWCRLMGMNIIEWKQNWPRLIDYDYCPITESEAKTPNQYLHKLHTKLIRDVKERASELIQNNGY